MFSKITLELLEDLALSKTFIRGEDYYKIGAVRKVKYNTSGDTISAEVRGRHTYTVTVYNVTTNPQFMCTCPYGGFCKHSVAVGLRIINKPGSVEVKAVEVEEDHEFDLEGVFKKATPDQKERFLMEIFQEDRSYRTKFCIRVLGQTGVESKRTVAEIRDAVKDKLETFDLEGYERFYDHHDPAYGYQDDWEVLREGARKELGGILAGYTDNIKEFLNTGNIIEATKEMLGLYEGISLIDDETIEDPASIFEDGLEGEFLYPFFDFMEEFAAQFCETSKSENAVLRVSEIVVERLDYYRRHKSRYRGFEYDLKLFKPFLKELVCSQKTAGYWASALDKLDLKNNSTDEVQLKIADVLEDRERWLQIAEKNFETNPAVARELLDYYKAQGDKVNLTRLGKPVLAKWADKFDRYLYESLKKEDDPELFADILSHYARREESVPLFKEYKKMVGQEQARQFLEKLRKDWDKSLYYIKLLEEEKDFAAILRHVKENIDDWNFMEYIKPILNVYPQECYDIIRAKVNGTLKETTGRAIYHEAVQWLKLLLKIKDKAIRRDIRHYFNTLYVTYNRRPALKDELRKAGIQPG